jgi:hypothetical protein
MLENVRMSKKTFGRTITKYIEVEPIMCTLIPHTFQHKVRTRLYWTNINPLLPLPPEAK